MARYKFSELINTIKRSTTLNKFVDTLKNEVEHNTFENRRYIDRKELQWELSRLDDIPTLWKVFKNLYKKNSDYDVLIKIDKQGYLTIQLIFPITQEELEKAFANRQKFINENGKMYACCVRIPEEVYKVCHKRIEKAFKGIEMNANGSYDKYDCSLVRMVDFVKCQ